MILRINLLPHREEKRRARRQQFIALGGLVALLAGLIVVLVWTVIGGYVSAQQGKNNFLKQEIAALDKDIAQIKSLQEQIRRQLAYKEIIESLQRDRSEPVNLLNEFAKQMPDGVYIKSFKQTAATISVAGYAQSNARVSTFMRNLESSPFLQSPRLIQTQATVVKGTRLQEFSMTVAVVRAAVKPESGARAAAPNRGKR